MIGPFRGFADQISPMFDPVLIQCTFSAGGKTTEQW